MTQISIKNTDIPPLKWFYLRSDLSSESKHSMLNAHDAPLPSVEKQEVVTMLFPSLSKLKIRAREGTTPALPSKVMFQTAKPTSTSRGFQCQQSN